MDKCKITSNGYADLQLTPQGIKVGWQLLVVRKKKKNHNRPFHTTSVQNFDENFLNATSTLIIL
jgi:hypothetical protein